MQLFTLIATGATVLASLRTVQGHAYIVDPKAFFKQGYPSNGYGSMINNSRWAEFDGATTNNYTQTNAVFFQRVLEFTKEKSLGAFVTRYQELYSDEIDVECGLTSYEESARSELPATAITYTGFPHPGMCEMWCDDTKLLSDEDCQKTYPEVPAKISYNKSQCANANRLTTYWIAVHSNPWQVYVHCVWLVGGSGRGEPPSAVGKGSSTPAANSAPSPTSTTDTVPSTTEVTQKSSGDGSASDNEPLAGKTDVSTPDPPTTEALTIPPSTTGAKCRRRRRN
ncbi:unnamed protein product [Peronospora destructor]|uniref:Uncharacterized protein n=1 Tax=Peronospora destructor TaxID=86335 RepID=A0AAV0U7X0_9STRA|nr:unnamed protein product [Peronospora destructor]CAI5732717.1 unnamed protein product [Peronospora destructor]